MAIPKSFRLFGTKYTVKQPSKVILDGESVLGKCDPDNHIIEIRRNLKPELKEVIYYHEITHLILLTLEYTKLGYDEKFVERVSKAMHQIITTQE